MIQTKTLKEALKDPGVIEVVGELLQKNYLYPFQRRSVPESDLNKFVSPGWGMIAGDSFKNIPNGAYKFGTVFLIGSPTRYDHVAHLIITPDFISDLYIVELKVT